MKIGIIGSRRRNSLEDRELLRETLFSRGLNCDVTFVSGGCPKGADRFAEEIARECNISIKIHHPDRSKLDKSYWSYVKMYHDRNTSIADDSDMLIALVAPDRKGGTEDTIKKFLKRKSEKDLILL